MNPQKHEIIKVLRTIPYSIVISDWAYGALADKMVDYIAELNQKNEPVISLSDLQYNEAREIVDSMIKG